MLEHDRGVAWPMLWLAHMSCMTKAWHDRSKNHEYLEPRMSGDHASEIADGQPDMHRERQWQPTHKQAE
jgi:hypothetical protein